MNIFILKRLDDRIFGEYTLVIMKKILTMCLLIIGLVVTGCGSATNNDGSLNNPVISVVTPDGIRTSVRENTTTDGIRVTLTGANFGSSGTIWYKPSSSSASGSSLDAVRMSSSVSGGISWSDTQICFTLMNSTRAIYPTGSFIVENNRGEKYTSYECKFDDGELNNAVITSVSPRNVYSYETNQTLVIKGSGFGNYPLRQDLVLYTTSGYTKTIPASEIYNWSDTQIMIPLPVSEMASSITSNAVCFIRTNNVNNTAHLASFSFNVPQIYGVEPSSGSMGKIVTLRGMNLGSSGNGLSVYCDNVYANVVNWSDDSIKVRIPNQTSIGPKNIQLKRNNLNVGSSVTYEVKAPALYGCSKSSDLAQGDNVTLNGSFFGSASELQGIWSSGRIEITDDESPATNNATIYMNDLSVTNWSDNAISFVWPKLKSNTFSDKTFSIKVIVGSEVFSSNRIQVTD